MDDNEFFDLLYQQWAKTTGAENKFWMSEADEEAPDFFNVYAVDSDQNKTLVATGMGEDDADFVSGVHGCLADLIRRLHTALDEAERFDYRVDEQEGQIADLSLKIIDLEKRLSNERGYVAFLECDVIDLKEDIANLESVMEKLDQDLIKANADLVYWQHEAHSYDWRNG